MVAFISLQNPSLRARRCSLDLLRPAQGELGAAASGLIREPAAQE